MWKRTRVKREAGGAGFFEKAGKKLK